MKALLQTAKVFCDPTRVRILALLRGGELCVCELVDVLAIGQSTLSTHLQVIRRAGLVEVRRQGKWLYYSLKPDAGRLLDFLLTHSGASPDSDRSLHADATRLKRRLALRDGGQCCVGMDCGPAPRRRKP